MGTMPIIIASAVISTGRKRVKPACRAASRADLPSLSCSRAKDTIRMLLAVATPMHMIAPVSDGTLRVVWVKSKIQQMPARAPRQRGDDDERIQPGLEIYDDQQVRQDDRAKQSDRQTPE